MRALLLASIVVLTLPACVSQKTAVQPKTYEYDRIIRDFKPQDGFGIDQRTVCLTPGKVTIRKPLHVTDTSVVIEKGFTTYTFILKKKTSDDTTRTTYYE